MLSLMSPLPQAYITLDDHSFSFPGDQPLRLSNRMTAFLCKPVLATNSSSISVFFFFEAWKQCPRTASAYSIMLLCVTLPPFSNTNFDATTTLSVTFIMSQCEVLTFIRMWYIIAKIIRIRNCQRTFSLKNSSGLNIKLRLIKRRRI